jgi:hypothetical protein
MTTDNQNSVSENSPKKKAAGVSCPIMLAGLLAMILLCLLAFRIYKWSTFKANPNNAYDTVQAFAYSLAYNKLDGLKLYVSEDKWAFIDDWSKHHQAISSDCKSPSDPDDGPFWMGGFDDSTQKMSVHFTFYEDCPDYFYMFRINADLKRIDNKWQVVGWNELCERVGEERCY